MVGVFVFLYCIFVRSDTSYNLREDLPVLKDLESIWIDIMFPKSKLLVIVFATELKNSTIFSMFWSKFVYKMIALMATKPSF